MISKFCVILRSLSQSTVCQYRETYRDHIENFFSELEVGDEVCMMKKERSSRVGSFSYKEGKRLLDVSWINHIDIDEESATVDLGPSAEMGNIIDELLSHGFRLPVTTDFMHQTVAGLVCGLGAESSSTTHGLFHGPCLEYEIYTPGEGFLTVDDTTHSELFKCIPGSFGTFGVLTNIKMKLCSSGNGVIQLEPRIYSDFGECAEDFVENMISKKYEFCEGVGVDISDPERRRFILIKGNILPGEDSVPSSQKLSSTTKYWDNFYYNQVLGMEDGKVYYYNLRDFFERWEPAFWFIAKKVESLNWYKRTLFELNKFRNYLRKKPIRGSCKDLYEYGDTKGLEKELDNLCQDVVLPITAAEEFLEYAIEISEDGTYLPDSVWICPIDCREAPTGSLFSPGSEMYVDLGFYGPLQKSFEGIENAVELNRLLERKSLDLKGWEARCNISYLEEEEYWEMCRLGLGEDIKDPYEVFKSLKALYDPQFLFPDPYCKSSAFLTDLKKQKLI